MRRSLSSPQRASAIRPRKRSIACRHPLFWLTTLTLALPCGCRMPEDVPTDPVVRGSAEAPAMSSWRDSSGDSARFFPGASGFTQETLILSSRRLEILRRLGPGIPLASNTLYVYRVQGGGKILGTILIRSASGEYGAIEVVLAVNRERRVIGVRLQRLREPAAIAAALTAPNWLRSFQGKSAENSFLLGKDLADVPAEAQFSARAIAAAVRSLLIEYDVAESRPAP